MISFHVLVVDIGTVTSAGSVNFGTALNLRMAERDPHTGEQPEPVVPVPVMVNGTQPCSSSTQTEVG